MVQVVRCNLRSQILDVELVRCRFGAHALAKASYMAELKVRGQCGGLAKLELCF